MSGVVPVVLFAYARPRHLARVLACLCDNKVPLIYAYADGAKSETDRARVAEVRTLLRAVDWAEITVTEREQNWGLGRNVMAGVAEIAAQHPWFIVWEDDLIAVPGTYEWMVAALARYRDDSQVMSVSAWTHPKITPDDLGGQPYFDARADCWVWGAYARSWTGMDETALAKIAVMQRNGQSADAYGADLPRQAQDELPKNIWAVRWLYHHFQHEGLCLRPPWSMVEHIGFDDATNASGATEWMNPPLQTVPQVPSFWPEIVEHAACQKLWQQACPQPTFGHRVRRALRRIMTRWKGIR